MSLLGERLLAVDAALSAAEVPHAFGGAIALAYCTGEPRGTRDLDVNLFVPPSEAGAVIRALPAGVRRSSSELAQAEQGGQVRLWWDDTPVDLFFDVHDFHRSARLGARRVPFLGSEIPVLGCTELVVFKARFNRTKDWADIEEMAAAGTVDLERAAAWLRLLLGPDAGETGRLDRLRPL